MQQYPGFMGPYAHSGNQWVGFDDVDAVVEKAFYVAEEELGGIMFWTIDNDDFRGTCGKTPYPLIESAKEAMLSVKTSIKTYDRTIYSFYSGFRFKTLNIQFHTFRKSLHVHQMSYFLV